MSIRPSPNLLQFTALAFLALGLLLLGLNVAGFFLSLRHPDLPHEPDLFFKNDITLTEAELRAALEAPFDDRQEYARRVTKALSQGIAHYWLDEGAAKYHLHVPPTENYLLWLAGFFSPKYAKYEFHDADKAIERGVGLCSQQAIIAAEVLEQRGLPARIIGLSGHVITTVEIAPEQWWILDPDYGVVVPHSLDAIESNPERIRPAYEAAGYSAERIDTLVAIYGHEGNLPTPGTGAFLYDRRKAILERASYLAIWAIPAFLLLMGVGALGLRNRICRVPQ